MYIDPHDGQPHYVTSDGSHGNCEQVVDLNVRADCADYNDTSGKAAPKGIEAGRNVAIWFSFYRTRMLMAKSSLMIALSGLSPRYRVGFASINGNGTNKITGSTYSFNDYFTDAYGGHGGKTQNLLAKVHPFGNGDSGTQRAAFWTWLANESPDGQTPLRMALNAVGQYYKTSQPWNTMPGEPGYVQGGTGPQYACRASYTILTTDGFWNGGEPSSPDDLSGAASTNGPDNSPVLPGAITQYTAKAPFSGGETSGEGASLADVATYYWEHDLSSLPNEVAAGTADPATWQHMTTFTMGLGFSPEHINPTGTTIPQIFAWARGGGEITKFSWPTPSGSADDGEGSINNIADLAHAAVNGHGDFFSAKNPEELTNDLSKALSEISSRVVAAAPAAVNTSVVSQGALAFSTGYTTRDWSGLLEADTVNDNGTVDAKNPIWRAGYQLNADYHSQTGYSNRDVYTDAYTLVTNDNDEITSATFDDGFQFTAENSSSLDADETQGLEAPALTGGQDTLGNRINYLLGDDRYEGSLYRTRDSILGAIIHAQPVYVSYPASGYHDNWPSNSPEAEASETYSAFVNANASRAGTVYMAANDGMLHAFDAALKCSTEDPDTNQCIKYGPNQEAAAGSERWAFIPRAVYANLGNLIPTNQTRAAEFHFRPTVNATPVTRDVYFSKNDGDGHYTGNWHTILTGGVGIGGRGVYALDITDPTSFSAADVLWEFDSDMTMSQGCVASYGTCKSSDLGYTISQPNIGRLANGRWVVLVPNGYFPDCSTPDIPTATVDECKAIAAEAPTHDGKPYSALFVVDAQTGKVIAELKTPTDLQGVTSFGLATPVLGDYGGGQVDQVAFAGDVEGNLWRFNLSSADPKDWSVTLAYKGVSINGHQGVQPITTMPRLFPDPATNHFMVVFGTGKYLGVGDNVVQTNGDGTPVAQALYGIRDQGDSATSANAYSLADGDLVERYLKETTAPAELPGSNVANPNAGASLRCVTTSKDESCAFGQASPTNPVPADKGGWYINLATTTSDGTINNAGERIVVNPGTVFASNTVVVQTLITGGAASNPCDPLTKGALMTFNGVTGGASGVSSLGGGNIAGGRINNARTSGELPMISALGGAKLYIPGSTLTNSTSDSPLTGDLPMWRRRSWHEIN
jgi:type IV pilus assembly protein PilY1